MAECAVEDGERPFSAVIATGGHSVLIFGSVLEEEAIVPHLGFWDRIASRS